MARSPRRRSRVQHLVLDHLEARSPASTLMTGLAAASPIPTAEVQVGSKLSRSTGEDNAVPKVNSPRLARLSNPQNRSVGATRDQAPSAARSSMLVIVVSAASFDFGHDRGGSVQIASLSSPGELWSPAKQPIALSAGEDVANSHVMIAGADVGVPGGAPGSGGMQGQAPVRDSEAGAPGTIRPLSLAPPSWSNGLGGASLYPGQTGLSSDDPRSPAFSSDYYSGGDSGGGSGGDSGGDPPSGGSPINYYPGMTGSGGGGPFVLAPGEDPLKPKNWTFSGGVPVGAFVRLDVVFADMNKIQSYQWAGAEFRSYFAYAGGDPSSNVKSMKVDTNVPNTLSNYEFVLSGMPKHYDIQVTVKYKPEAGVTPQDSVLKVGFDSIAPTKSTLSVVHSGHPDFATRTVNGVQEIVVGLWQMPFGDTAGTTGIRIKAETTTAKFKGDFMFLQLVKINESATIGGISGTITSVDERQTPTVKAPGEWNLDDGEDQKIGYQFIEYVDGDPVSKNQWEVPANTQAEDRYMNDSPNLSGPTATTTQLTIGSFNGEGDLEPQQFATYLMYKPEGGVWVAMYKIDWSFGISISGSGAQGYNLNVNGYRDLVAIPNDARGEWPSWVGRGSQRRTVSFTS